MAGNQLRDLTASIIKVSMNQCLGTNLFACFDACRLLSLIQEVGTEVAGFGHPMGSLGIIFVGPVGILFIIEISGIVRTGDHAVSAANTPVMIDDHDAIISLVSSLDRANLSARRVLAVVTHQEDLSFIRFRRSFFLDVDLPDPMDVPPLIAVECHVVLFPASDQTLIASGPAFLQVDHHAPLVLG
jgi:hypothetical protein